MGAAQVAELTVDLADARIVRALLAGVTAPPEVLAQVHHALSSKDASTLQTLTRDFPAAPRQGLLALVGLYGGQEVLDEANKALKSFADAREALSDLKWLASQVKGAAVTFDLADARGYGYYSGARFAVYAQGAGDAVLRGGRYDGVGAVFGHKLDRERPAVGFSLDVKQLVRAASARPLRKAIRAAWNDAIDLRETVRALRARGETVVFVMPGHDEIDEFDCDRELVEAAGRWVVRLVE